jgi:hypothetical protein
MLGTLLVGGGGAAGGCRASASMLVCVPPTKVTAPVVVSIVPSDV